MASENCCDGHVVTPFTVLAKFYRIGRPDFVTEEVVLGAAGQSEAADADWPAGAGHGSENGMLVSWMGFDARAWRGSGPGASCC
jgi:hypothetical protein